LGAVVREANKSKISNQSLIPMVVGRIQWAYASRRGKEKLNKTQNKFLNSEKHVFLFVFVSKKRKKLKSKEVKWGV
jgi:hypothetical protein